jgi:type IV secretion system protein VirB6
MAGGVFIGVEKHLIGGITDATKGLMMSYSSMIMGLAATSATLYIMWRGYQTWQVSCPRRWRMSCGTS